MVSLFSNKKELVVSGCSMTSDYVNYKNIEHKKGATTNINFDYDSPNNKVIEEEWKYIEPFPVLGDFLAENYKMKHVNLSFPGSGNRQIFNKAFDYVMENKNRIGFLVVCWTGFTRIDHFTNYKNLQGNRYHTLIFAEYKDSDFNKMMLRKHYPVWKMLWDQKFINAEGDISDFYRYALTIQNICEYFSIPCVQCASIITYPDTLEIVNTFINHKLHNDIDDTRFYGWPIFYSIGGENLFFFDIESNEYKVTKHDGHPNKKAHQEVSKKLIKFIDQGNLLECN